MKVNNKGNRWKVKKNLNLNVKGKKITKKSDARIPKQENIKHLLECLEEGNLNPVRNYLKSQLPVYIRIPRKRSIDQGFVENRRQTLIDNQTKAETFAKILLKEMGVKFVFQQDFICKNKKLYYIDFYLPLIKVGIEIDGGYHMEDTQVASDKERQSNIEKNGVDMYRFTNEEVFQPEYFRSRIKDILTKYEIIAK